MKTTVWVLAAALTMPGVAMLGQQNSASNGNGSGQTNQSHQETSHAMKTGSPNDNGRGLVGEYGQEQPGTKVQKVHKKHHHKSKKYTEQNQPNQTGTRSAGEANPQ